MKNNEQTYPLELVIGNIETVIVDPHNEVFSYWYKRKSEKTYALLHIDNHDDMCLPSLTFEGFKSLRTKATIEDYAKSMVIGQFISPAAFYGILDNVYWFDPRKKWIRQYNQFIREELEGRMFLGKKRERINIRKMVQELNDLDTFLLDIDLDAFASRDDMRGIRPEQINQRIKKTTKLLKKLKRPAFITIARSIHPRSYTVESMVEELQERTIEELSIIYG